MRMPKLYRAFLISLLILLDGMVSSCGYLQTEQPPEIVAFIVNPAEIKPGEKATLLWNVTGAIMVTIDPGIGTVPVAGIREVSPNVTTTYTLTAANLVKSINQTVTLTVHKIEQISPTEKPKPPAPKQTAEQYYAEGIYLIEKGRYEHAISQFGKALELEPNYSSAYHGRGLAYFYKGDCSSAIVDYTRAIELNPALVRAYFDRGMAYQRCDKKAEAIADFKKFTELSSDPSLVERAKREIKKLESPQDWR